MWNRDGRNSALDRAQALLSAKRNDANESESRRPAHGLDDPGGGSFKKSSFPSNTHILSLDLSDLSSVSSVTEQGNTTNANKQGLSPQDFRASTSLGEGGGGTRFLKKAVPKAMASTQSPQFRKNQTQHPPEHRFAASSQSAALSRLASIEGRVRASQLAHQNVSQGRSTVAGNPRRTVPPTASDMGPPPSRGRSAPVVPSAPLSPQWSSDDPGSPRKRFLKKTVALATADGDPNGSQEARVGRGANQIEHSGASAGALQPSGGQPEAAAAGGGVSLDSDEEDMRKLLGDSLDSTEDSLLRRRRFAMETVGKDSSVKPDPLPSGPLVSPAPPSPLASTLSSPPSPVLRSLSSPSSWGRGEVRSLEELFPAGSGARPEEQGPHSGRSSSVSSEDFKFNIMSLDDLVPDFTLEAKPKEHRPPKHEAEDRTSTPQPLEAGEAVLGEMEYESDFQSLSIRTEPDHSPSEISEHLGPSSGDEEKRKRKKQKEDDVSEISSYRDGSRRGEDGDPYVDPYDDTYDDTFSDRSRCSDTQTPGSCSSSRTLTPSSRRCRSPKRPGREAATQTQPDPLSYTWAAGNAVLGPALGMAAVDPTPVAALTVGAEALEVLTAYSPAVFALNDMLRQQLAVTQQFAQSARHLHHSVVQGLGPADYTYTSLEDTKQFIQKHRPPKLTVEQALEEVLQEMRDYHYI